MNYKKQVTKKPFVYFLKAYLDHQIYNDDEKLLPSGSKAINIDSFIDLIKTNERLNKIFISAFESVDNLKFNEEDYNLMALRVKVSGQDKKIIDDFIINSYFSSKYVIDALATRDEMSEKKIDLKIYQTRLKQKLRKSIKC